MDYPALITAISDAHRQAQAGAAGAVNRHLVFRNWLSDACLVEFEQSCEDRAGYGVGLLKRVSVDLRGREVQGASPDMLERMRFLYLHYPQMSERISAPAVRNSGDSTPRPLPVETRRAVFRIAHSPRIINSLSPAILWPWPSPSNSSKQTAPRGSSTTPIHLPPKTSHDLLRPHR
jgi:hypothetical protein